MRVRHRLLLMVLLAALPARAQQHTKNLGLLLGGQAYENQNWQRLDQAVCQRPGDPTLCVRGGPANILQGALAPFACGATTSGLYTDTDCNQICRCNPGQAKWCRSDTGACFSATDCCLAGAATTTTTTLPIVAPPSWVSTMLAAWMLDEASGTRVNLQGTTSRDLSNTAGCGGASNPTQSTVDKMEGAAAAVFTATTCLATTDVFPGIGTPLSVGCWNKSTSAQPVDDAFVMHDYSNTANTFKLRRTNAGGYEFDVWDNTGARQQAISPYSWSGTPWSHVVGTVASGGTVVLYVNGVQVASTPITTLGAANTPFYLGENSFWFGNLDECFFSNTLIPAASVCRICSCGIRGEQCACSGSAYVSTGRNATACGSCTLPATCNQATP